MSRRVNAARPVPQSREACALAIKEYGILCGEVERIEAEMNQKIAALTSEAEMNASPLRARIEPLRSNIQSFCESRRDELTNGHDKKCFDFTTGRVEWRAGSEPIQIEKGKEQAAIQALRSLKLSACLKASITLVKAQLKKLPQDKLAQIPGVSLVTGPETFNIKPFEGKVDAQPELKSKEKVA